MKEKKTVEDLVTNGYLLLELRSCLFDRYCIYDERNDDDGIEAIEELHRQLFGKTMSEQRRKNVGI